MGLGEILLVVEEAAEQKNYVLFMLVTAMKGGFLVKLGRLTAYSMQTSGLLEEVILGQ